jgi:predicted  nucleic acid-binding Zn-ribbon protein
LVESERHDLVLLVQLQNSYDQIGEAIRERQTPPPEVKELQVENRRRDSELQALEAQVTEHTEEVREIHKREEEWKAELEHFQRQKGMVTNEREFTAVISEIDYATKALTEATERRQELEGAIEELTQEIESRRQARPEEESAHKEVVESWEQRKEELKRLVHQLAETAQKNEAELNPKHRARFLRLLESKKGTAVAAVADGSCSVCHFAVRPHLQQRVRRCQEIIACEHCHRILFFEETIQEGLSEANAS